MAEPEDTPEPLTQAPALASSLSGIAANGMSEINKDLSAVTQPSQVMAKAEDALGTVASGGANLMADLLKSAMGKDGDLGAILAKSVGAISSPGQEAAEVSGIATTGMNPQLQAQKGQEIG